MAYIVTEPCIDIKDGACAQVCPVDCIYEGGRMFYIHPDECINCGLCLSVCPVDAILSDDAAASRQDFMEVNRDFFGAEVSNIGSPGGWEKWRSTSKDHPQVEQFRP